MALIERVGETPSGAVGVRARTGLDAPPESLIREVEQGLCFLFAGERLSSACGVPVWTDFLAGLIDHLGRADAVNEEEATELCEYLRTAQYDRLASSIRTTVPLGEWHAAVYAQDVYGRRMRLSEVHDALARVPFCAAVTPNLDPLIERLMGCEVLSPSEPLTIEDRLAEMLPFVLKLRGATDDGSLTLWPDVALSNVAAHCAEPLTEMLRARTMLAIGVTAEDLMQWLEAAGATHCERTHYLIGPPLVTGAEFRAVETLLRRFRVRLLTTSQPGDSELLTFLRELSPNQGLHH